MPTSIQRISLTCDATQVISVPPSCNIVTVDGGSSLGLFIEVNDEAQGDNVNLTIRILKEGDSITEPMAFIGSVFNARTYTLLIYQVTQ